jgi:predicted Zn-dependent peptidase
MLGGGLKSPLYDEIREKNGLVYFFHCYQSKITFSTSVVVLQTETSNENVEKVQNIISSILANPKKYMTQERFQITKEYYINNTEMEDVLLYCNARKTYTPSKFLIESILKDITYEEILRVYNKYFDFSKFYKSVDKNEFENKQ